MAPTISVVVSSVIIIGAICAKADVDCDESTVVQLVTDLLLGVDNGPIYIAAGSSVGYVFVNKLVADFNEGYGVCQKLLTDSTFSGTVDRARLAVFETPDIYTNVMSAMSAGGDKHGIIGAINDYQDGKTLNQYYWLQATVVPADRLCYIFDNGVDGLHPGTSANIPSQYTLIDPVGTGTPFVVTVRTSNPKEIIPIGNSGINLPIICEFGCGPGNYSRTPEWNQIQNPSPTTTKMESTITTSTDISSSLASTSVSIIPSVTAVASFTMPLLFPYTCASGGPEFFCNQLNANYSTVVINDICYAIGSPPSSNANFNPTSQACTGLITKYSASQYIEYGRIAVFKTPAIYKEVMDALQSTLGINAEVLIGATSLELDDGKNLSEYKWTNANAGNGMCLIFSPDGTTAGRSPSSYSLVPPATGSGPYVLIVNPMYPDQFTAISATGIVTGTLALFEYGCDSADISATPEWNDNTISSTTESTTASTTIDHSSTGASTSTSATTPASICNRNTVAATALDAEANGFVPVYYDSSTPTIGYFYLTQPLGVYSEGYDYCGMLLSGNLRDGSVDYARLAVFETPTIYKKVMDRMAVNVTTNVIIGAHSSNNGDGSNLGQWFWTSQDENQMCYIFDNGNGQGATISIPSEFSLAPIVGDLTNKPYVLTVAPCDPYHFVPMADMDMRVPAICEFGCGEGLYKTTPEWTRTPPLPVNPNCPVTTTSVKMTKAMTSASETSVSTSTDSSSITSTTPTGTVISTVSSPSTSSGASSCDVDSCDAYTNNNNFEYSMVINGVCFAYRGTNSRIQSFGDAYDECNWILPKASFDYARVSVFETPSMYNEFMAMLKGKGITNENMIIGAINDGKPGCKMHEFMWANGDGNEMCYIFNNGQGGTDPPKSEADVTRKIANSGTGQFYVLCGNPSDPFNFTGYWDGLFSLPYVCEFGCGATPIYASTPEWDDIPSALAPTTTSTSTSTSKPSTKTTKQSTSIGSSTSPTLTPSTSSSSFAISVGETTPTNAAAQKTCNPRTVFDRLSGDGYLGPVAIVANSVVYVYVKQLVSDFNAGQTLCDQVLSDHDLAELADRSRLAVFEKPAMYKIFMDECASRGVTSKVIIGAHNDWNNGESLGEWYWVQDTPLENRMCYIFDDSTGQNQGRPGKISNAFSLGSIVGDASERPYVWTAVPSDPYHVIPVANKDMNLPVICEYGCGSGNYSTTPEWAKVPNVTTSSSATTVSSSVGTSGSCQTDAAKVCSEASTHASVFIGSTCYVYMGDTTVVWNFDDGYNQCRMAAKSGWQTSGSFDYGRLATFPTPTIYSCVMESLKSWTTRPAVLIGAYNKGQGGGSLNEFIWGVTKSNDYGCQIFDPAPSTYPDPSLANVTKVTSGGGQKALVTSTQNPYNFLSYIDGTINQSILCEFGCGSSPSLSQNMEWMNLPATCNLTTTTTMASTTTSQPATCNNRTLGDFAAKSAYNLFYKASTATAYFYMEEPRTSLWDMEAMCYSHCDETGVGVFGRLAMFETYADYQQTLAELVKAGTMSPTVSGPVVFGAVGYSTATLLNDFRWASWADLRDQSVITESTNVPITVMSCGFKLALALDPKQEGVFYAYDYQNTPTTLPFLCQCKCGNKSDYKEPSSSASEWDWKVSSLLVTAGTTSAPCSVTTTIASTTIATSSSSSSTTPVSTSSESQTTTSTPPPSDCDLTVLRDAYTKSLAYGQKSYFLENVTTSVWYVYKSDTFGVPDLIEIDNTCDSLCNGFDSRLYGRSATFKTKDIFESVRTALKDAGQLYPAVIGAAGLPVAQFLSDYSWTAKRTNQPNAQSQITTQTTYNVSQSSGDPYLALAFYPQIPYNFISYDVDSLKTVPFMCECGCGPYVQIDTTAPGWDTPLSTTTVASSSASSAFSTSTGSITTTSGTSPGASSTTTASSTQVRTSSTPVSSTIASSTTSSSTSSAHETMSSSEPSSITASGSNPPSTSSVMSSSSSSNPIPTSSFSISTVSSAASSDPASSSTIASSTATSPGPTTSSTDPISSTVSRSSSGRSSTMTSPTPTLIPVSSVASSSSTTQVVVTSSAVGSASSSPGSTTSSNAPLSSISSSTSGGKSSTDAAAQSTSSSMASASSFSAAMTGTSTISITSTSTGSSRSTGVSSSSTSPIITSTIEPSTTQGSTTGRSSSSPTNPAAITSSSDMISTSHSQSRGRSSTQTMASVPVIASTSAMVSSISTATMSSPIGQSSGSTVSSAMSTTTELMVTSSSSNDVSTSSTSTASLSPGPSTETPQTFSSTIAASPSESSKTSSAGISSSSFQSSESTSKLETTSAIFPSSSPGTPITSTSSDFASTLGQSPSESPSTVSSTDPSPASSSSASPPVTSSIDSTASQSLSTSVDVSAPNASSTDLSSSFTSSLSTASVSSDSSQSPVVSSSIRRSSPPGASSSVPSSTMWETENEVTSDAMTTTQTEDDTLSYDEATDVTSYFASSTPVSNTAQYQKSIMPRSAKTSSATVSAPFVETAASEPSSPLEPTVLLDTEPIDADAFTQDTLDDTFEDAHSTLSLLKNFSTGSVSYTDSSTTPDSDLTTNTDYDEITREFSPAGHPLETTATFTRSSSPFSNSGGSRRGMERTQGTMEAVEEMVMQTEPAVSSTSMGRSDAAASEGLTSQRRLIDGSTPAESRDLSTSTSLGNEYWSGTTTGAKSQSIMTTSDPQLQSSMSMAYQEHQVTALFSPTSDPERQTTGSGNQQNNGGGGTMITSFPRSLTSSNAPETTAFRSDPTAMLSSRSMSFTSASSYNSNSDQTQSSRLESASPPPPPNSDASLASPAPNLFELLTPLPFRIPPGVLIDNSVTLLPRDKMNASTIEMSEATKPSLTPIDRLGDFTRKDSLKQNTQPSAGNLTPSTLSIVSSGTISSPDQSGGFSRTSQDTRPTQDPRELIGLSSTDSAAVIYSQSSSGRASDSSPTSSRGPMDQAHSDDAGDGSNKGNTPNPLGSESGSKDSKSSLPSATVQATIPLSLPASITPPSDQRPSADNHLISSPIPPGYGLSPDTAIDHQQESSIDGSTNNKPYTGSAPSTQQHGTVPMENSNQSSAPPKQPETDQSKSRDGSEPNIKPEEAAPPSSNSNNDPKNGTPMSLSDDQFDTGATQPSDQDGQGQQNGKDSTSPGEISENQTPPTGFPSDSQSKNSNDDQNLQSKNPNSDQNPPKPPPSPSDRGNPQATIANSASGAAGENRNSQGSQDPKDSPNPKGPEGVQPRPADSSKAPDADASKIGDIKASRDPRPTGATLPTGLPSGAPVTPSGSSLPASSASPASSDYPISSSNLPTASMETASSTALTNPSSIPTGSDSNSISSSQLDSATPKSFSASPNNGTDGNTDGNRSDQTDADNDPDAGDMDKDDVSGNRKPDPMSKDERMAADIMHSLGCIWVVGCCGACFVLGMITNWRSPDRQMSYSQELSLMLQHLLILLWHDATAQSTLCTAVSIAIQYFTLVFYTSMLLDSIRNLLILVAFLDRPNQISSAAMQVTAWAAPSLVTGISAIMYYKHYDSDFSCWINANHSVAYFTIVPVSLMSAFGIIINEASGTLTPCQPIPGELNRSHNSSFISRHGFFFVLPLSLCSWAIGFSAVFYQNMPVYVTVSGINIALGVEVFFFHAMQNDQIRALLKRMWMKLKSIF